MKHHPMFAPFGANWPAVRSFLLDLVYPEGAVCRACGKISDGEILCPSCRTALRSDGSLFRWDTEELDPDLTAYFMTPHTGIARTLVLRLKHQAEACAVRPLADLLLPLPKGFSFPPDTVVTWVSMPENRRRDRMIDHGRLLAEAAAAQLNLPCRKLLLRRETSSAGQNHFPGTAGGRCADHRHNRPSLCRSPPRGRGGAGHRPDVYPRHPAEGRGMILRTEMIDE